MSEPRENIDENSAPDGWNTTATARKLYTCHKFDCDFETFEPLDKCPKCGFPILDTQTFKLLGVLLCFLGGILAVGGGSLLIFAAPRLRGDSGVVILVYGLFGALTLMGMAVLAGGLKQALTGYKSSSFITVFLVLLLVTAVIAAVFKLVVAVV